MIPHWDDHERLLRDLATADLNQGPGLPVATLVLFDGDQVEVMVRARPEGDRDGCDHLSEMATVVAARRPQRIACALPGRVRDLVTSTGDDPVAYVLICNSAEHRDGGWHHRTRMLPYQPDRADVELGTATDVEVELSPVGSLLDDAVRHASDHDPLRTLSVLATWGHTVAVPTDRADALTGPSLPVPRSGDRHRAHRLAIELHRRHAPAASVEQARRRPAIVTDIPPGWDAACPL